MYSMIYTPACSNIFTSLAASDYHAKIKDRIRQNVKLYSKLHEFWIKLKTFIQNCTNFGLNLKLYSKKIWIKRKTLFKKIWNKLKTLFKTFT